MAREDQEFDDDLEFDESEFKIGRKAGRPRGTTKISKSLAFKYEILLGFLRYLTRKHEVPRSITNKIFFVLEDPAFSRYILRAIERIINAFITKFASKAVASVLDKIPTPKRAKTNPPLAKAVLKFLTAILKRPGIRKGVAVKFLKLMKVKRYREMFFKQVLTAVKKEAKAWAGTKTIYKETKVKHNHCKKTKKKRKKNPVGGELHEVYPKLQSFEFTQNRKPYEVILQGSAKVHGITGGKYDGGLLLKGNGLKGFKEKGAKLTTINAQKGAKSNWPYQDFTHPFRVKPDIIVVMDGCLVCYKKGKRLHKEFNYD